MKIIYITLGFLLSTFCFSLSDHDREMSNAILDSSISPGEELIFEALEFDPENQRAHQLLTKLMYSRGDDLHRVIDQFSNITQYTEELTAIKLELLYRLGEYKEISDRYNEYTSLVDSRSQFYIIDSHIRRGLYPLAKKILTKKLYSNPYDLLFNELNYILYKDSGSLRIIRESEEPLTILFRLYGRSINIDREDTLIKRVLQWEMKNREFDYNKLVFNYEILPFLSLPGLDGDYLFDTNYNLFIDTKFKFSKDLIVSKEVDRDGDSINDSFILYSNSLPSKIIDEGKSITYGNYPYVDSSEVDGLFRSSYFKDKVVFRVPNITSSELPNLDFVYSPNKTEYREVNRESVKEFWEFKTEVYTVVSRDLVENVYTHKLLLKNNEVVSGVRDLDIDGDYDIYEEYLGGQLISTLYLKDPNFKYYENYLPISFKIISDENGLNSIILEGEESNIAIALDDYSNKLEDIVDFNKDEFNWWQ